jgi:hypothetical protein
LAHLFQGLAVWQEPEIMKYQGQYPVLFLTFKDCKATTAEQGIAKINGLLQELYLEYQAVLYPHLAKTEQQYYDQILAELCSLTDWEDSLKWLIRWLKRTTGRRVIILLDEYDTPVHAGQEYGYYEDIVPFLRNLLSGALKDNSDLEKGVLTGILRIAKESIFSGLNNLEVLSLLRPEFQDCFGFTEAEVEQLIQAFSLTDSEILTTWYNGYLFGNQVIYNPWSVLNFLTSLDKQPRPYWINTSSDALLQDLVTRREPKFQSQIETLLAGGTIQTHLNENIVLRDLERNEVNIWSLLVFSGYLKPVHVIHQRVRPLYELAIPNLEVYSFYEDTLQLWVQQTVGSQSLQELLRALTQADWQTFGKCLKDMVLTILSYHDTAGTEPERVYHAFVLGLLTNLADRYQIRSNRESGYGRYDVLMIPRHPTDAGFILEFKKIDRPDDPNAEAAMQSALQQIQQQQYAAELRAHSVTSIWGIGVVVEGKTVWVESVPLEEST